MKKIIRIFGIVAFYVLCTQGCGSGKEAISPKSLLGEWYTIKGVVEAYSFQEDENSFLFVGTVGMRPVIYGTWLINNDKFSFTMDNGTTTEYSISLSNDTLIFNDGEEIYTRTIPLHIKYPEVQILNNIASDFIDLKFSHPQLTDLNWGYRIDNSQSVQEFTLKGYSILTRSILSAENPKELSEYIRDYGFESDTLFRSDVCDGYLDDNQIITVCVIKNNESANDSIDIVISSGLIIK